jgi:hypothetical protein
MHCHFISGRRYYQCRGNDRTEPCRAGVREDRLTPWIEELFTTLDRFRPAELADAVTKRQQQGRPHVSPGALEQIDGNIERRGLRFQLGHLPKDDYLAEYARLQAQREELEYAPAEPGASRLPPLGGLMDGWRTGDQLIRQGLVAAFFEELDVKEGDIVSIVPRREYAAEVVAPLEALQRERNW